jgi:hypothetical protein
MADVFVLMVMLITNSFRESPLSGHLLDATSLLRWRNFVPGHPPYSLQPFMAARRQYCYIIAIGTTGRELKGKIGKFA